jgi:3-hydroxy-9,10-secoandrosta-1,3,5(10)-triene-9,17-dione monooxygenase
MPLQSTQPKPSAAVPTPAEMIARARAMIPVLAARARQGERDRRIAKETIADMHVAGFFRVLQPKRWGGYEMDVPTCFEIQMALAEGDMSVAWVYGVIGLHPWLLALYDDRAAQDIWGTDNTTLMCSSLMPVGAATPVEGGYRLNGRWKYSSGSDHCAWAILGGTASGTPGDSGNRRFFLVPRSDYEIEDTWHVPGLKATGSNDIVVKDVFVPAYRTQSAYDNFLGVGPGQAVNTAALYKLPFGQVFFRGVSNASIGALQAMLDGILAFAKSRTNRAHGGASSDDPMVQIACAETAAAIDEMKTILHRNFRNMEAYAARGEMPPVDERLKYKFHSALAAERCSLYAARLFKTTGAAGLNADLPFGRILCDINAARQHVSNQFDASGRNWGAVLFGATDNKDFMI